MGKIQDIEKYIGWCDEATANNDYETAKELQDEIIGVYSKDIPNIKTNLDNYQVRVIGIGSPHYEVDYFGDIKKLKAKLQNYKYELEEKEKVRQEELEVRRMAASGITIQNQNSSSSTSTANSSITITLEQTLEKLTPLLPPEEIEELEDKISALELAIKKDDKGKSSSKMSSVLKFIADKGIDVAIATIPYLCSII